MNEHRRNLLEVLQGETSPIDGGAVVVGFGLVVELLTPEGKRGVSKITSDGTGRALPWYMGEGYAAALRDLAEFDEGES